MRCNYDNWGTQPPKSLNENHIAVLQLMSDGETRARVDMLRDARPPTNPNPRSENDFAGWNKIDYNLYKVGLLICTAVDNSGQKSFRISAAGLRLINEVNDNPGKVTIDTNARGFYKVHLNGKIY